MKAALYINPLGGGDYSMSLVDEERHAQITAAIDAAPQSADATDLALYFLGDPKDAIEFREQRPDLYPEPQRGAVLGHCFTQDLVWEHVSWPEVQIVAVITLPYD